VTAPGCRLVALGASNLTRGLSVVTGIAAHAWGGELELYAALGHGRSYGVPSSVLLRRLPGILESSLWRVLEAAPARATRAVITDVGNDILYGHSAGTILEWVEECAARLAHRAQDLVITGLPLASIGALSPLRFAFFRTLFAPRCRLGLAQTRAVAAQVDQGLRLLARRRGVRFVEPRAHWYGLDPIHLRRRSWPEAWNAILLGDGPPVAPRPVALLDALRLEALPAERQWVAGIARVVPQTGAPLPAGGRGWFY